ncbi:MAG: ATP-binding protein [Spirochaetia bacterium]|jgi:predicted ATP-dependent endonuclease of OLD family|nr:ATP-binding protein [Spirochaetia bacterium]
MNKVLRIEYQHIELFKKGFVLDLTAKDRIVNTEQVHRISDALSLQKVIAFAGINATGKTTAMRLVNFALGLLHDNTYLATSSDSCSLFSKGSRIIIDFIIGEKMYRLDSSIGIQTPETPNILEKPRFYYAEETIYSKELASVKTKKALFDWTEHDKRIIRSTLNPQILEVLNDNHSIVIMVIKPQKAVFGHLGLIDTANFNILPETLSLEQDYINLFDERIETIRLPGKKPGSVRFKRNDKTYSLKTTDDVYHYLSSGTIKGILLMSAIEIILRNGDYLLLDEIEIHLNKTLVDTIIGLFKNKNINKKGAVLIFSTHYLEILDAIDRKDAIYVFRKDNDFSLTTTRYSDNITRNDIKKSEALLSNYFGNTAPDYEAINNMRTTLCKKIN